MACRTLSYQIEEKNFWGSRPRCVTLWASNTSRQRLTIPDPTGGLCESQHKFLTYELRIRSQRKSAPHWDSLLTGISFAHNITPVAALDELSPFNLVFGRKPRLSAIDVCFPRSCLPLPLPDNQEARKYLQNLHKALEGLSFRALDATYEAKEVMRNQHDNKRGSALRTKPTRTLAVGDIISCCKPTPTLKKLSYQWSEPTFVVVAVATSTCTVRQLAARGGITAKQLHSTKKLPGKVVNRKMTRSFPVPDSFFLGAKVLKKFSGKWYAGTVTDMEADEDEVLWRVVYEDFDSDQVTRKELASILVYHPLLSTSFDIKTPDVGSCVWFSQRQ